MFVSSCSFLEYVINAVSTMLVGYTLLSKKVMPIRFLSIILSILAFVNVDARTGKI